MSTDWVQVAVCVAVGACVGGGLVWKAEAVAEFYRREGTSSGSASRRLDSSSPTFIRLIGAGFIAIGVIGTVMGLFFADKM